MALTQVNSDGIKDGEVKDADVDSSAAIATSKISGAVTGIASHGLATSATTDTTNASNIGSGTLAAARVADLPASKITSGTIATARLGTGTSSATNFLRGDGSWQTAAYDDSNLRRDLNVLALQTAVDTNRKAYNLQNSFIDQFEDATGIGSLTTASRDNSEYVSTTYTAVTTPSRTQDADSTGTDGNYSWYRWTDSSGTGSFQSNAAESAEILIVAGGGGGGTSGGEGGGGGAGGLIYYGSETPKTPTGSAVTLSANQSYTVTVGAGGSGATNYGTNGGNGTSGGNSSLTGSGISLTVALGGGTGGNYPDGGAGYGDGVDGGSGGGGGGNYSGTNNSRTGGSGTSGQGHDGGDGHLNATGQFCGGGGGGAGEAGQDAQQASGFTGGKGGNGLTYAIIGTSTTFGGGGGGWTNGGTHGAGGSGGGGAGGSAGTDGLGGGGGAGGGHDGGNGTVIIRVLTSTSVTSVEATGTVVGAASTASSSRTKVSGTFLYKNHAGTATIGTDLKIYFTCNGGTNWTEAASYTAGSDFSTGIKTVYLGETTCTAGTDVRYKAVWANQADGSKQTQLHGVGINY